MNKPDKSSIFKTSLLVALLGSVFGAQAAGLGKLTVYSAIGQPLNAEVSLSATAEELGGLSAKLASHQAFQDAGIEFMPALTGLRIKVGQSPAGQPVLRLTTDAPLNEPFLHFLVELNWTAGRMVREYTFLLDPPEMLQVAKPASVVAPSSPAARASESSSPASRPVTAVMAPRATAPARDTGEVKVKTGDTLNKIAREYKPESVSLDQMLVALFNGNREAFIGDNMNRLRAGKILKLPAEEAVARVDPGEARRMIVSQAADFNAYRRRLAEAATAAPASAPEPQQSASGRIKPQIEQKAPPAPKTDKLEVSRTESAKQAAGIDKGRLEEELIARDKALREASERIAQLEKNLEGLKRLAELKSQAGAQAQQQAQAAIPAPAATEQKKPEVTVTAPVEAPKAAEPAPAPAAAAPAPKPPPPSPKPEVKKPAPPPPPPEPDFIAENPELVFGGGGLIALLLGYLGFNAWRRKKQAKAPEQEVALPETPSFLAEPEPAKAAEPGSVVSLPEPADDVSILGDFSQGALTTEESADPVAEADVLMAYGRDGQAEEILLEGLKSDPGRSAIHLKLMELYANRKDAAKFEAAAQELHALSRGQGPEWERAILLARDLGVAGALFAHAPELDAVASAPEAEPMAEQPMEAVPPAAEGVMQAPPAATAVVPPAAPVEDEVASLDFDLDLGTTSMPAAIATAEVAAQPKPAEEAMSLDFDFDLGTPSVPEPAPVAAEEIPPVDTAAMSSEDATDVDSNAIDFSLDDALASEFAAAAGNEAVRATPVDDSTGNEVDFDLGLDLDAGAAEEIAATHAVEEAEPVAIMTPDTPEAAPEPEMGDVAGAGLDFDLGADEEAGLDAAASSPAEVPAVEDFGLSEISLDLDAPVGLPASTGAGLADADLVLPEIELPDAGQADIDLPALDLDLDADMPAVSEDDAAVPSQVDISLDAEEKSADSAADSVDATDDPEVATKLELAQAYEEMGDREGARELLNEVLNEGSPAQQALARTRLDQLDV